MNEVLQRKWHDLLHTWTAAPGLAAQIFEEVCAQYAGSGRFYHTLAHIQIVLDTVDSLASHARNVPAVQLAGWLHDVIYDSRAADNEERSAAYAEQLCERCAIPLAGHVGALIRQTKTHDAGGDPDAQVLLDADLAILGARESTYQAYAGQIRQEYAWVPEADYRHGRRQVLCNFLTRPRIFSLLNHLEEPARHNLSAEITRLALP